jgi:hypothetical protein
VEIIAEIVLQILGWAFQFFGELLLQMIGEAIAELIGHSLKEPFRRPQPAHPALAAFGTLIFGAVAGAISLLIFPDLFIKLEWLRVLNLALTPLAAGALMAWIGRWRRRHEKEVIRLESFAYGFCFAFAMALVRHVFN